MKNYSTKHPASSFLSSLRKDAQVLEEEWLMQKAAFSSMHSRLLGPEDDHRLPYKRDVDRIIHSKGYARYSDKTQVAYLIENDHITQRGLHVQLVSNFSRGIAEILRLNLDLVEAIALGHDVGHPPFGHEGEGYLSELSEEFGNGKFAHPWQSCRLFTEIEPLNLGFAVYDGFLCHDGGMKSARLQPCFEKTWEDHHKELAIKREDPEGNLIPATLEGCLVKLCDTVSYLGRDIEDAISLGILEREQIPPTILGKFNREILSFVAQDIIKNSYGKDYIAMSEDVLEALLVIRKFNFEHIYIHPKLKVESEKIQRSYRILFSELLKDQKIKGEASYLWQFFVRKRPERYREQFSEIEWTIDFIAGMTDHYFVRTLENLMVPQRIQL